MVSTSPFISKSSSPCIFLVSAPRTPITNSITATFIFHGFFNSLARSRYLSFFSHSFSFTLLSAGTAKSTIRLVLFSLLILTRSGHLDEIKGSVSISKSRRGLCVLFSRRDSGLCKYHLFVGSNLNFLHSSQSITFPTQSCLVLYSLCDLSFRLNYHITYICCFVESYQFLLWYDWSLWCCFVLLLEVIQFLSWGFHFLATSTFSRLRCCLLVM